MNIYQNNLKNQEFEKEAPQNSCLEQATIADKQGAREDKNSEVKLTQSKTDSLDCLGITEQNTFFSAIPGQADPFLLRNSYQNKLVKSFKAYLAGTAKAVNIDLSPQIEKIEQLYPERPFSPLLYARYVQLKDAYDKKDLQRIFDSIQLFNHDPIDDYYTDERVYGGALEKEWERPFLQEIRETSPLDPDIHPEKGSIKILPLIDWKQADFPPPLFFKSLDLLSKLDTWLYQELEAYASHVKFYSSHTLLSVTSPRYFGAIYMHVPEEKDQELFYLETLAHETSHLHLFTIMDLNPLLQNGENDLYVSPIRADKRPMLGIVHAVFALSRMVRILRLYCEAFPTNTEAKELLIKRENGLKKGMTIISSQAQLTQEGKELFQTIEACAYN